MVGKMVKVNLLQDQQATVEVKRAVRKVSGVTQQLLMLAVAGFTLVTILTLDYYSASRQNKQAKDDFTIQSNRAAELKRLTDRRADLVRQKQAVDDRIAIIKQLKSDQNGPVTMLSRLNQKLPDGSLYLFVIKNTDKGLALIGRAESEAIVQRFAHNLEYSSGTFTNVEAVTVLAAKYSGKDELLKHVNDIVSEMGVGIFDMNTLSKVTEDMKDPATPRPIVFAIKCTFNNKVVPKPEPAAATPAAKGQVAELR